MTYDQIRLVRSLLAAVLIVFGCVVARELWVSVGKKRASLETAVPAEPADPLARQVELTRLDSEGRKDFVLRAAESVGRSEGLQTFRDVEISFAAGKERIPLIVSAHTCTYDTANSAAHLEGNVVIRDQKSLTIETSVLEYRRDPERAWSDAPVRFSGKDMEGEAGRLDYDVPASSFRLGDGAAVSLKRPGRDPIQVESRTAVVRRRESLVQFVDDVVAVDSDGRLSCNDLQVYLMEGESGVEHFEAYENVELLTSTRPSSASADSVPSDEAASSSGEANRARLLSEPGSKRLLTEKFEVFFKADGQTLDRARALDGAKMIFERPAQSREPALVRELEGYLLAFDFDPLGRLTDLRGRGGVVLTVRPRNGTPADEKRVTARQIEAQFDPITGDLIEGRCLEAVEFAHGDVRATGDLGVYEVGNESLTLTETPRLWDRQASLEAETIRIDVITGDLEAAGQVRSTLMSRSAEPGRGFFPGSGTEPVHFVADHLTYRRASDAALYTGSARGLQGENRIESDRIELKQSRGELSAAGSVRTVMLDEADGQPDRRGAKDNVRRTVTRSEALQYRSEEGVLHYRDAVTMQTDDLALSSQDLDVTLQPDGTTVSELRAKGKVEIRSADATARGEYARYLPKTQEVQVTGDRAWLESADKLTEGKELTFFLSDDRILVDGREESRTRTIYASKPRPM